MMKVISKMINDLENTSSLKQTRLKSKIKSQQRFLNIVVHDLRNPSESIKEGLALAKQLLTDHVATQIDAAVAEFRQIVKASAAKIQKQRQLVSLAKPRRFTQCEVIQMNSPQVFQTPYQNSAKPSLVQTEQSHYSDSESESGEDLDSYVNRMKQMLKP